MTDAVVPQEWLSAPGSWEVDGYDFVDKKELVNTPLRIDNISFRLGRNDVPMVFIEAQTADGSPVQFSDASSGILRQICDLWISHNETEPDFSKHEVWHPVSIVVRHGLRVSRYQREGSKEWSETYYLRASGKRASDTVPAAASAPLADGVASGQRRTAKQ
jgi:hypothetical protein